MVTQRPDGPVRHVVVVGAGQAGSDTAAQLRAQGYAGRLTLVGDEGTPPYARPPLSKTHLAAAPPEGYELRPASFYPGQDIALLTGDPARSLDRPRRLVRLDSGRQLPYDRLVLATGAAARTLPVPGAGLGQVRVLRTLADADALRTALGGARRLLVVGGGFLGLEIASSACARGVDVTVLESAPRLLPRAVGHRVSRQLAQLHRDNGVRVLTARRLSALHGDRDGRVCAAELDGGERLDTDLVVVAVGAVPRTRLAAQAALPVADGVLVDGSLRTADPAVHAVGDCARFPGAGLGATLRLESVQNAAGHARHVAAAVLGSREAYRAVPWFWTEQHGLRLQIAGTADGHDRTVLIGDPDAGRFSVLSFAAGRLLAAESVNRPADHMIARKLLAEGGGGLDPQDAARPGFDLKEHSARTARARDRTPRTEGISA
ncbi:NAD(P)/FAD-dependent oxidoreductase [Streptomyces sp. NPDC051561]|uniref:NAD(P)/FAD-dependent oxidoreductase n=1 Tax=Streptomyces sp. NPDC051561 TaxID=3365658 RepID=UPI0037BBB864